MVHSDRSTKTWKRRWKSWKSEDELRTSKVWYCSRGCILFSPDPLGWDTFLAGRVPWYMDQVKCVLVPVVVGRGRLTWTPGNRHSRHVSEDRRSLSPREPFYQGLTLSGGARFIPWPQAPFLGNADGDQSIFGIAGRVWGTFLRLVAQVLGLSPQAWGAFFRECQDIFGTAEHVWATCFSLIPEVMSLLPGAWGALF